MSAQDNMFLASVRRHYSDNVKAFLTSLETMLSALQSAERLNGIATPVLMGQMYTLTCETHDFLANEKFALDITDAMEMGVQLGDSDLRDYTEDHKALVEKYFDLIDLTLWGFTQEFPLSEMIISLKSEMDSLKENLPMMTFSQAHLVATSVRNIKTMVSTEIIPYIQTMNYWWPDIFAMDDHPLVPQEGKEGVYFKYSPLKKIQILNDLYYLANEENEIAQENMVDFLIPWLYGYAGDDHTDNAKKLQDMVQEFYTLCPIIHTMTESIFANQCPTPNPYEMYPGLQVIHQYLTENASVHPNYLPFFYWQIASQTTKDNLLNPPDVKTSKPREIPRDAYDHPSTRVFDLMMSFVQPDGQFRVVQTTGVCFVNPVKDFSRYNSNTVSLPIWQRCGHEESKSRHTEQECYCVTQAKTLNVEERVLYRPKTPLLATLGSEKLGRRSRKILLSIVKGSGIAYAMSNFEEYKWFNKYFPKRNNKEAVRTDNIKVPLCGYPQPYHTIQSYKSLLREGVRLYGHPEEKVNVTVMSPLTEKVPKKPTPTFPQRHLDEISSWADMVNDPDDQPVYPKVRMTVRRVKPNEKRSWASLLRKKDA